MLIDNVCRIDELEYRRYFTIQHQTSDDEVSLHQGTTERRFLAWSTEGVNIWAVLT